MKKINRYSCLFGIMVVAFVTTILPIKADNEFYFIPDENMVAYKYWFSLNGSTTYDYENNNDSIYIPSHSETTTTNYNGYYCYSSTSNANFANYCRYYNSSNSSQVSPKETTSNSAYYETVNVGDSILNISDGTLTGFSGQPTAYNANSNVYVFKTRPLLIYFWSSYNFAQNEITLYPRESANATITFMSREPSAGRFYRMYFKIETDVSTRISINWGSGLTSSTKIRPIYIGSLYDMPDTIRDQLNQPTRVMELLASGNDTTQNNITNNNQVTTDLDNHNSELHSLENNFNDNINNAFDDIDLTNNITSNNKFISSAIWVRRRFDELIIGTPFEYILVFSLILGIGLTIVGKLRG